MRTPPPPIFDPVLAEMMRPAARFFDLMDENGPNPGELRIAMLAWLNAPEYVEATVRRALAASGLVIRRIERLTTHPVWSVTCINPSQVQIPESPRRAATWMRGFLRQYQLDVAADAINVVPDRRSVHVGFVMYWGFHPEPVEEVPLDDDD